ncbi:MAG: phosphatase PAP2 family protein [Candidatus Lokiarchaeota archaeon]|nr:phosphatase PAP2 family protein [Candidatus Lokiarchaeota archaeon]
MNEETKMNEETQVDINLILKILILAAITFIVGLVLLLSGLNIWFNEFFYDSSITYTIFSLISELGDTLIYILLIVVVWYTYDKKLGKNLAFSLFGSYLINSVIKDIFQDPRPYTNIRDSEPVEEGFGFPSGHSQQAVATWGYLAYEAYQKKNKILFWIFTILVYVIASSRVIIGVHDVQDVWGGLTFGFLWLIFFILLEPKISPKVASLSWIVKIVLSVIIPIALFVILILIFPTSTVDYGMITGAMMGLALGYVFETEKIKYEPRNLTNMQRIINVVIGLVITLILYLGLSRLFPESQIMDFLQYLILSFILVGLVPWIFVKINRKS